MTPDIEKTERKLAFITGASEGLGRTFARQLAQQGYNTVCIARNEARLQDLTQQLTLDYLGVHDYLLADLTTEKGISSCLEKLKQQHVHVLINNAGFSQFGTFHQADIAHEQNVLKVNVEAALRLSHGFLQQAQRGDGLINLSSITNSLTTPVQPVYCATKCFIASFSESLWYQERKRGVYVQALLPGVTKTEFMNRSSKLEGFKMQLINFISASPDSVIKCSLNALQKRKGPIVIPGLSNKLLVMSLRLLPRKWVVFTLGKVGDLAD